MQGVGREQYYPHPYWHVEFTKDEINYSMECVTWIDEFFEDCTLKLSSLNDSEYTDAVDSSSANCVNLLSRETQDRIDKLFQSTSEKLEPSPPSGKKNTIGKQAVRTQETEYLNPYLHNLHDLSSIVWQYVGPPCSHHQRNYSTASSSSCSSSSSSTVVLLPHIGSFHTRAYFKDQDVFWLENQTTIFNPHSRGYEYILHICFHDEMGMFSCVKYDEYGIPICKSLPEPFFSQSSPIFQWACSDGKDYAAAAFVENFLSRHRFTWVDIDPLCTKHPLRHYTYRNSLNIEKLGDALMDVAGFSVPISTVVLQFFHPLLSFPWYFRKK